MPNYRRAYVAGGTYFFTLVTHRRRPLFAEERWREALRSAFETIQMVRPFTIAAIVLLPDHLLCVLTLPQGDTGYSIRWKQIKEVFTRDYLAMGGVEADVSDSRIGQGERGVRQRRFWEHTCRDQDDVNRCIDYIHWNPVKHGLAERVRDYSYSSFHRFVKEGTYPLDWGAENPCPGYDDPEWE